MKGVDGHEGDRRAAGVRRAPVMLISTRVDSSLGPVWIACGSSGVVAVDMLASAETFEARLARRGFGRPMPLVDGDVATSDPAWRAADLARLTRDLVVAFLAGQPVPIERLPIDLADRPEWDRLVLAAVRAIPRGSTVSYGEMARRIGHAGASRAVGGAVGRNPIGLIVPCHRVIAADGSLGGYGVAAWGGREAALELKRRLLKLEGVRIPN